MAAAVAWKGPPSPTVKTVYLVRHGEAIHNVEEQAMKRRAGVEAEALGHASGSRVHAAMCETAQKAALKNEAFRDAPLSEKGRRQAAAAKTEIMKVAQGLGLGLPTAALASPLQRTLQTAAAMFPILGSVHVCGALRERRTGLPCDEPQPAHVMARRPSFAHMHWVSPPGLDGDYGNASSERPEQEPQTPTLEDAPALRRRTEQLAALLHARPEECVCVVGHKGYLRELERGPLGRPGAEEFGTCEVRVYDVFLPGDGTMVAMLRYCKGERGELVDPDPLYADQLSIALSESIAPTERDHSCDPLEMVLVN